MRGSVVTSALLEAGVTHAGRCTPVLVIAGGPWRVRAKSMYGRRLILGADERSQQVSVTRLFGVSS